MTKIRLFVGDGKGTRGSRYYYVMEGNLLIPLREYVEKKERHIWVLDLDKIANKRIVIFDYTRSGLGYFSVVTIDALTKFPWPYYGEAYIFDSTKARLADGNIREAVSYFMGYEFWGLSKRVKSMVRDLNDFYLPMISDVKNYLRTINAGLFFGGKARRVEEAFAYGLDVSIFSALTIDNNRGRVGSLRTLRRWIYQIWVLKEILNGLRTRYLQKSKYSEKSYIYIGQGEPISSCVAYTDRGPVTFWFEFQPTKGMHLWGMIDGKRHYVRPDIVAVKGEYRSADGIGGIDLIVECKEDVVSAKDLEQVEGYIRNYKPRQVLLVSLKSVPEDLRGRFEALGVKVIDGLVPQNLDIRRELRQILNVNL